MTAFLISAFWLDDQVHLHWLTERVLWFALLQKMSRQRRKAQRSTRHTTIDDDNQHAVISLLRTVDFVLSQHVLGEVSDEF